MVIVRYKYSGGVIQSAMPLLCLYISEVREC
ncbi:hypothetical protein BSTP3_195 [Bacillus phage BSTP3]|nr:hypothetical protein BSTP3_195 [Bacillus phage BSTP3]